MKKVIVTVLCVVVALSATGETRAQGPRRRLPRTTKGLIKYYSDQLLRSQQEDGRWVHRYELGMTALAVLALKHSNDPRAAVAVANGAAFLAQAKTEYKTYSAGTIISALYLVNKRVHGRIIDRYATLLVKSQCRGDEAGIFGYNLLGDPKAQQGHGLGRGDNSNTQFAVLGLLFAQRAGHQVPKRIWQNLKDHYTKTQNPDGGWGYRPGGKSTYNMTFAGAVSLYIAEEQLALATAATRCAMRPPSRATEAAMDWVGRKFDTEKLNSYGLYALERLGILTGRSEFNGHYWYREGSAKLKKYGVPGGGWGDAGAAFVVLFLSRGQEPIIINKLKYRGDWNTCNYDVKHMTEYISDKMQSPMQWRIITLDAKLPDLLKVPILHLNGIKGPQFSDEEKIKIRNYVLKGGVLMAQACKGKKDAGEFDQGFRELVEECFPEGELKKVPASHLMFKGPLKMSRPPTVEAITIKGRVAVVYLPRSLTLAWHRGGSRSKTAFTAGVNMIFYILKQAGRLTSGAKPIRGPKPPPSRPRPRK